MKIPFTLNSEDIILDAEPDTKLLQLLRDNGIFSVKDGCKKGSCGSCTVLMDGKPVPSCIIPSAAVRILAALGRVQLKRANMFFEKRKKLVMLYNELFKDCDFIKLPPDGDGNSWHIYLMRIVPEKLNITRNELSNMLQAKGIGISMHFIPHFHMTYMKKRYNITPEMFPNAQKQYETTLTIPLWPDMPEEMVEYTANTIKSICKEHYVG